MKKRRELYFRDREILEKFLKTSVPRKFYTLKTSGRYDFSYSYEEVYDYSDALLRGEEIDLSCNFAGVPASAVNEEFQKILDVLARRSPDLDEFCSIFSKAIGVVLRAGN